MDTAVAVHQAALGLALVLMAMALAAREDPEMLVVLAMVCADPTMVVTLLLMIILSVPDVTERRK